MKTVLFFLLLFLPCGVALSADPESPVIVDVEVIDDFEVGDSSIIWADDFETIVSLTDDYHDVGSSSGSFGLSSEDAFGGSSRSVRQLYEAGQVNAGWMWYFFGDHPSLVGGDRETEIHARWYHKFDPGFQGYPPKMARLGGFALPDWTLSFMAHHWIQQSSGLIIADVASNIDVGGTAPVHSGYNSFARWLPIAQSDFDFDDSTNIGRWVCHEMQVKLNTPFTSDAEYRQWADGRLILDIAGRDLVAGYVDRGINGVQWDCYWNSGSPVEQSRYYDNIVISTEPIGPAFSSANPVVRKSPFADTDPGDDQTAWRLQIAADEEGNDIVWSGTIEGDGNETIVDNSTGSFQGSAAGWDRLPPGTPYRLRAAQRDSSLSWSDWSPWHSVLRTGPETTGVDRPESDPPDRNSSIPILNCPNPFNPSTEIRYAIPAEGRARLTVHDVAGALVTILADRHHGEGKHTVVWSGRNEDGTEMASGIYFARLKMKSGVVSKKLVLVK